MQIIPCKIIIYYYLSQFITFYHFSTPYYCYFYIVFRRSISSLAYFGRRMSSILDWPDGLCFGVLFLVRFMPVVLLLFIIIILLLICSCFSSLLRLPLLWLLFSLSCIRRNLFLTNISQSTDIFIELTCIKLKLVLL